MEIGNLTKLNNGEQAWDIMGKQNQEYLGESWDTTAHKMEMEGTDTYLELLGDNLAEWTDSHIQEQTELWYSLQAVGTDIKALENIINTEFFGTGENITKNQIGWAWHLLYSEQ